jgi:hypothetical protein
VTNAYRRGKPAKCVIIFVTGFFEVLFYHYEGDVEGPLEACWAAI